MSKLSNLIETINNAAEQLSESQQQLEPQDLATLTAACDRLMGVVESPVQTIFKMMMAPHTITMVRVAIEMQLFDAFQGEEAVTLQTLSERTRADPDLIVRIARVLTASRVLNETGEKVYQTTPIAQLLVNASPIRDTVDYLFGEHLPMLAKLPQYLSETGFRNPDNIDDSPFQYAFGTKLPFYSWLEKRPERLRVHNSTMTVQRAGRSDADHWFNYFPLESTLLKDFPRGASQEVFLVDVGGGLGHDMLALTAKFPDLPGRLVLQDLANVISTIKDTPPNVECQAYDMFTPQPIRGAYAYYFHTVLHDFADSYCLKILSIVVAAMGSHSRLLINELCFDEKGIPLFPAQLDICMMTQHGSLERAGKQWQRLLGQAGLEVVQVHTTKGAPPGGERLIEARKAM